MTAPAVFTARNYADCGASIALARGQHRDGGERHRGGYAAVNVLVGLTQNLLTGALQLVKFTASVPTTPGATLLMVRTRPAPASPTDHRVGPSLQDFRLARQSCRRPPRYWRPVPQNCCRSL